MAAKNKPAIITDIDSLLPDNTTGDISPADVRAIVKTINDSAVNRKDDALSVSFNTVADLRAANLSDNVTVVNLLGYRIFNDGGGTRCYVDKTDTTTTDDSALCFVTSDGVRVKRHVPGYLDIRWFGARDDLVNGQTSLITANTVAIQACLNAAINLGKSVYIPYGRFLFNDTLLINAVGLTVYGDYGTNSDSIGSNLEWTGTTGKPAILLGNGYHTLFKDFNIRFQTPVDCLVRLIKDTTRSWITTGCKFENMSLGNSGGNRFCKYCIEITANPAKGSADGNNDVHRFVDLRLQGYSEAAVMTEMASQAHDLQFIGCTAYGNLAGKHVLYLDGGFFHWIGGSGGANTVSDFYINSVNAPLSIYKWNSEHSYGFVKMAGATTAAQVMDIRACRYQPTLGLIDDFFIDWRSPGLLSVESCLFDFSSVPSAGANARKPQIRFIIPEGAARAPTFVHTNNLYVDNQAAYDHIRIDSGSWRIVSYGNSIQTPVQQECDNFITGIATFSADLANLKAASIDSLRIGNSKLNSAPVQGSFEFDGAALTFTTNGKRFAVPINALATGAESNTLDTTSQSLRLTPFAGITLEAASTTTNKVSAWASQGSVSNTLTGNGDPTWYPFKTFFPNGKPGIKCVGTDQGLYTGTRPFNLDNFTIYFVLYNLAPVTVRSTIWSLGEPNDGVKAEFLNGTDLQMRFPGGQAAVLTGGLKIGLHVYAMTFTSAALTAGAAKTGKIYVDNGTPLTFDFTSSALVTPAASFTIGFDSGFKFSPWDNAFYGEMIAYTTVHNDTTVGTNIQTLLSKWA